MDKEFLKVLSDLKSSHSNVCYGALIMLRTTLIKSKEAVNQLLQERVIEMLIKMLRDGASKNQAAKTNDIILSILANLCLEEDVREQVMSCNGISAIAEVVMTTEQESIHNRGVRAISNLAQHLPNLDTIFKLKLPSFVAKRLMETEDKECISTYLRSIRILGHTGMNVKRLVEESMAVSAVASILKKDKKKLIGKSLQVLHEMSSLRCCAAFAQGVLAANVVEELIAFADDDDKPTSFSAFAIILRLADHENLRPPLGNAGAIDLFMREMNKNEEQMSQVATLNALCLCSRESVNRQKLHSANVLELFISCLDMGRKEESGTKNFSMLYDRVISSLVNFLYDDICMSRLLELDLINVLISHLYRVTATEVNLDGDLGKEINILASLAESGGIEKMSSDNTKDCCLGNKVEESMDIKEVAGEKESSLKEKEKPGSVFLETQTSLEELNIGERGYAEIPPKDKDQVAEDPLSNADLDEEVNEIVSNPQRSNSKLVFSINSPTYQQGHSSWSINDYSSGVTCKSFNSDNTATPGSHTSFSMFEDQEVVPYSPLGAGASYYSPAYSPSYSLESSSPKYSPNPQGSSVYSRGQGSSQGSPAWSLASSSRLSPVDGAFSPSGLSFSAGYPSPSPLQGPLSPVNIHCPMTPPPPSMSEDHGSESPLSISQMPPTGFATAKSEQPSFSSESGQLNVSMMNSSPAYPFVRMDSTERLQFAVVPLSQEELIYSASEEDAEEEQEELCPEMGNKEEAEKQYPEMKCEKGFEDQDRKIKSESQANTISSSSQSSDIISHNSEQPFTINPLPSPSAIFHHQVRSLSLPSSSTAINPNDDEREAHCEVSQGREFSRKRKFDECWPHEGISKPNRRVSFKSENEDLFESSQPDSNGPKETTANANEFQLFNTLWKEPVLAGVDIALTGSGLNTGLSRRFPPSTFGSLSPSPYSSPASRHGLSPFASPRPLSSAFHDAGTNQSMADVRKTDPISKSTNLLTNDQGIRGLNNDARTSSGESSRRQTSSNTGKSNSGSNERLINILRTSESNILILLSNVSIKNNPSQHLVQLNVFRSLLNYLSLSSNPLQRCFRLLNRVCKNSLCFQNILLIQGPALIVRHLIQEPDGSFPSVLFNPPSGEDRPQLILDDTVCSSQNSNSSSQASEFGRRMEFEFGMDAYCQMTAKKRATMLRSHPTLSLDGQLSQDVVYDGNCNRKRVRIQMALSLLRSMSSIALSRYGDGEVKHLLARGSTQEKLQCVISVLHLLVGCGSFSRCQLLSKVSFNQVIPFLFISDAPLARDAIVTAISLCVFANGMSKTVEQLADLPPCPDISGVEIGAENRKRKSPESKKPRWPPKRRRRDWESRYAMFSRNAHSKNTTRSRFDDFSCKAEGASNSCQSLSSCVYSSLSCDFDVSLVIVNENEKSEEVFKAHKKTIMNKSHYFSSMLGGYYNEANKNQVILKDVSVSGFEYVIHYLHGCCSGCSVIDLIPTRIKGKQDGQANVESENNIKSDGPCNLASDVDFVSIVNTSNTVACPSLDETAKSVCDAQSLNQPSSCHSSMEKDSSVVGLTDDNTQPLASLDASDGSDEAIVGNIPTQNTCNTSTPTDVSAPSLSTNPYPVEKISEDACNREIDRILDKCEDVLGVADQFLLTGLVDYISSVLSHLCLSPRTCEFVLGLVSFYKLDNVIIDCVLEMVSSCIPRSEVSEFIFKMGNSGFREQIESALSSIIRALTEDSSTVIW